MDLVDGMKPPGYTYGQAAQTLCDGLVHLRLLLSTASTAIQPRPLL